jgi:phosphoglycerol transferase MdoB-like AlkP superfamily enzyme
LQAPDNNKASNPGDPGHEGTDAKTPGKGTRPTDAETTTENSWLRSRYGFAALWFITLVVVWFVLRAVFVLKFPPPSVSAGGLAKAFLSGFQRDCFVALLFTLPLLFWFWIIPNHRFRTKGHRYFLTAAGFVAVFLALFLVFVEYYFFEEFKSRFNTVAVDYLIYPQEVFVNIWESYHVAAVVSVTAIAASLWIFFAVRAARNLFVEEYSARTRFGILLSGIGCAVLLLLTFNPKSAHVGPERSLNEIANSGPLSFMAAAVTRNLDYTAFYKTNTVEESYNRARGMLQQSNVTFTAEGNSIRRQIGGDTNGPKYNLVVLLEESLGSEYWGSLGAKRAVTPEMDKLAKEDGLFFTNIYACGNRTVRGMEGVLSSFPPLPGDSIVKRDKSDNVETLARVLKRDGYSTMFLYGGRGVFDGMRSYALRNGYDRFIEQKDFAKPTFTTAWGVCDEDLMNRALEEFNTLNASGKPFFATLLSVSNHKPYTYPAGRIPEDPNRHSRFYAAKYADYALGLFFKRARQSSFWTNTLFAVVADHGSRVYGRQSIPIHSYEIPVLVAGPALIKAPVRNGQLGCSLDVGPTLLGLMGRPYESMFFGRDLLNMSPSEGRVFLNHNRDIGMLAHERLVVLGLMQTVEFYEGDPKKVDVNLVEKPTDSDREIEKNAIAIYQVADDLYTHSKYRIDK